MREIKLNILRALEIQERKKRKSELVVANKELLFQNVEKVKRAAELLVANKELLFQNDEKEKREAELVIANAKLIFQNEEKEKRAAELVIANKELAFQHKEKENRAAELVIANAELTFQNLEKEKRAAELLIANTELAYQNDEKENRAAELAIANAELRFQNLEKEKRAAELIIANKELAFQNDEKEKRAAELAIANAELTFQNLEKEKRAAELVIANNELTFQNTEKERHATALKTAHKDLESFTFISSHDIQEPLRKIQIFSDIILSEERQNLSIAGKRYFEKIQAAASHTQTLIQDLLAYTRTNATEKFEIKDLSQIVEEVKIELEEEIFQKKATIEAEGLCKVNVIHFQFRQLLKSLIGNALKFSKPGQPSHIVIKSVSIKPGTAGFNNFLADKDYCHISIADNGIGFDEQHKDRIFEMFQRLNDKENYQGSGMGLTIAKKIVQIHGGVITAIGELDNGASFHIYIPLHRALSN